jgi:predicted SprT family Zn-dependent metalloprotease
MRLTPVILEAAYEFLRRTPPFSGWKLPEPDDVEFHIARRIPPNHLHFADFWLSAGGAPCIRFSERRHKHTATVLATMGHEMIHLYQHVAGRETKNTEHNREFHRLAKRVCDLHGWDAGAF